MGVFCVWWFLFLLPLGVFIFCLVLPTPTHIGLTNVLANCYDDYIITKMIYKSKGETNVQHSRDSENQERAFRPIQVPRLLEDLEVKLQEDRTHLRDLRAPTEDRPIEKGQPPPVRWGFFFYRCFIFFLPVVFIFCRISYWCFDYADCPCRLFL